MRSMRRAVKPRVRGGLAQRRQSAAIRRDAPLRMPVKTAISIDDAAGIAFDDDCFSSITR